VVGVGVFRVMLLEHQHRISIDWLWRVLKCRMELNWRATSWDRRRI